MNRRVYSVAQVNAYIHNMFRQDYALNRISVQGEVSNCTYHRSGHIYFTLKDDASQISCVMFAGKRLKGLKFQMKDGDKVVVSGAVDVYERDGRYQLYAESIELAGAGVLYERFLALKNRLEQEGLFDPAHKKPIPAHTSVVGIVTAPTGAAVRDIIRNAKKRNPYVQLYLYPALVQGDGAAESVVRGIEILDRIGCDCIIVGRGGGSIEDLWAFNEEIVARAIYECDAPVISAVGHETDTTIADFAADLRVATPTEAAVRAVEDIHETFRRMDEYKSRLGQLMDRDLALKRGQLEAKAGALRHLGPESQVREKRQRLEDIGLRLERSEQAILNDRKRKWNDFHSAMPGLMDHMLQERKKSWNDYHRILPDRMNRILEDRKHRSALAAGRLDGLSPVRKLSQGYSYTENQEGRNVSSVEDVKTGEPVNIIVRDGIIQGSVTGTEKRAYGTYTAE